MLCKVGVLVAGLGQQRPELRQLQLAVLVDVGLREQLVCHLHCPRLLPHKSSVSRDLMFAC